MTRISTRLFLLAGTLAFGSLFGVSSGDSIAHFTVRSSVPAIVTPPNLGELEGAELQVLGPIEEWHFTQGYVDSGENSIRLGNMHSNVPVTIRIQNNGWDLPAGYDTVDGPKKADGSDFDFGMYISSVSASRGEMSAIGGFSDGWVGINNTPTDMLRMGSDPFSGRWVGVANGEAFLSSRMNLDAVYDIPGEYVVHLELTIGLPF